MWSKRPASLRLLWVSSKSAIWSEKSRKNGTLFIHRKFLSPKQVKHQQKWQTQRPNILARVPYSLIHPGSNRTLTHLPSSNSVHTSACNCGLMLSNSFLKAAEMRKLKHQPGEKSAKDWNDWKPRMLHANCGPGSAAPWREKGSWQRWNPGDQIGEQQALAKNMYQKVLNSCDCLEAPLPEHHCSYFNQTMHHDPPVVYEVASQTCSQFRWKSLAQGQRLCLLEELFLPGQCCIHQFVRSVLFPSCESQVLNFACWTQFFWRVVPLCCHFWACICVPSSWCSADAFASSNECSPHRAVVHAC